MKFSIITVCYNSALTIEKTIQSIVEQDFNDVEFLIIDGGSTDGTKKIIEKYKEKINYYISEKDLGIYDAMNKGIKASTGDVVSFMNSDDWYLPDVLLKVNQMFEQEKADIIYGDYYMLSNNQNFILKSNALTVKEDLKYGLKMCHQSMFFRKSLFDEYGNYNIEYKIAADYEWVRRIPDDKIVWKYINLPICIFSMGGISTENNLECEREVMRAALKYCKDIKEIEDVNRHFSVERANREKQELFINNYKKYEKNIKLTLYELMNKKLNFYLYGGGFYAEECIKLMEDYSIIGIIDSDSTKKGRNILGIDVVLLNEVKNKESMIIISTIKYEKEVQRLLINEGYKNIFLYSSIKEEIYSKLKQIVNIEQIK